MIGAKEALARLREGNRRFVSGVRSVEAMVAHMRREQLVAEQRPFAIVLGCSDSRAPAEIVFDQGLGDLFVIRVAGNIVAPSQVGSVEFAAARFGTRLVIVLGHSRCGAVTAALDDVRSRGMHPAGVRAIVDRIRPIAQTVLSVGLTDEEQILRHAVRANVRASVDHLRHGSALLEGMIAKEGLVVVGAEYSLESGEVDFFEGDI